MDVADIQQRIWEVLSPSPEIPCGHCGGTGWITLDVPIKDPAFGKAFVCVCQREGHQIRLLEQETGIFPDDSANFDFEHFEQHAATAAYYARQMVGGPVTDEDGEIRPGLLLYGSPGCGKSTLAAILFRNWIAQSKLVRGIKYLNLIERVQRTYDDSYEGMPAGEIIASYGKAPYLILDELGSEWLGASQEKQNRIEIVYRLVDYRSNLKLPTVITSNLFEAEMEGQFGRPVMSRILGLCHAVEMKGPDFRRKQQRETTRRVRR